VSPTERSLNEEEEIGMAVVTNRQGLEDEHPGIGKIKGSRQQRVLGSFVHQPESTDLALWALFPLLG
jgi:hypothetical protein